MINHSSNRNVYYENYRDFKLGYAMKDFEPGEELLVDYLYKVKNKKERDSSLAHWGIAEEQEL